jgi:hypothetical protein
MAMAVHSYIVPMLIFFAIIGSLVAVYSQFVLGGPRMYSLLKTLLALLMLWAWIRIHPVAGSLWFLSLLALQFWLDVDYRRRKKATDGGARGGPARYLSFVSQDGRRPLALFIPALKKPLYWVAARMKSPLPQTGGRPAGEAVKMMLDQLLGQTRGFRLDTRHMGQTGAPPMEIRCD